MKKLTIQLFAAVFTLLVGNSALQAQLSFTGNNTNGCAPLSTLFTITNSPTGTVSYQWNFDDGSGPVVNTNTTYTRVFSNPGNYSVTLTALDANSNAIGSPVPCGCGFVQVNGAEITVNSSGNNYPVTVCLNDNINFGAFSIGVGTINSPSWDFGDQTAVSNQPYPSHTYTSTGTYTVTLTSSTSSCGTATTTKTIIVSNSANIYPTPVITFSPGTTCQGNPVTFTTNTSGTYLWNFGDPASAPNNSAVGQTSTHSFSANSSTPYNVTLTVTNGCQKTGSATAQVNIAIPHWPTYSYFSLTSMPSTACANSNVQFNAPGGYSSYKWNYGDGSAQVINTNSSSNYAYSSSGNYPVSVTISQACGGPDTTLTLTFPVTSHFVVWPTASWMKLTASPIAACPNSNVTISAPTGYSSYTWNFGDGSQQVTNINASNTHLYVNSGHYPVSVRMTQSCGSNDTTLHLNLPVQNTPWPASGFSLTASPSTICPNSSVQFTAPGGYNNYVWDFGDNSQPQNTTWNNVNYTYSSLGNFTVSVRISAPCHTDTTLYLILPVANQPWNTQNGFTLQSMQQSACPGSNVQFNAPNGGGNTSYTWNFGEGSPQTNSNSFNSHVYNNLGNYNVSVTVHQACHNDTTLHLTFPVMHTPWNTQYGFNIQTNSPACPGTQVNFNAPGGYNTYLWNFGEGSPQTGPNSSAQHTYANIGNYTVSVKISNCGGDTTIYTTMQINNGLSISAPDTVCFHDVANFNTMSQVDGQTIVWSFGDGTPNSTGNPNASHTYAAAGTYTVTLTAKSFQCNMNGNIVSTTKTIVVNTIGGIPHPNIFIPNNQNNSTCLGAPLSFITDSYASYHWDFGDGTYSNQQNPQHTFTHLGRDTVRLMVTTSCGKTGVSGIVVNVTSHYVWPQYWNNVQPNPTSACPNSTVTFNAPQGYPAYVWHFGDGSQPDTTVNSSITHTYGSTLQLFNYSVKIVSACGNDTTIGSTINITQSYQFPTGPNFAMYNSSPACPNSYVNLSAPGGYPSYIWHFGDGSPDITTGDNSSNNGGQCTMNHIYVNQPSQPASVTIVSACGTYDVLTSQVVISSHAPFPIGQNYFQLNAQSPVCPNDNVSFNAPGGYPSYQWNFNDGSPLETTTDSWDNHVFVGSSPTHNVSVLIKNGCGDTTRLFTTVQVNTSAGFPNYISFNTNSPACPGASVNLGVNGSYSSYTWHFGDGSPNVTTTGNQNGYSHTYGNAIVTDTAWVNITNGCGHDTTLYALVKIRNNVGFNIQQNGPGFQVNAGPNPACKTDQVGFQAPSGYSNYLWSFGDGDTATSSQNNANHIYSSAQPPQTFHYSVKITNACGHDTTLHGTVVISTIGVFSSNLGIQTTPNTGSCPRDLVDFNINQGNFQSYSWNFGDGYKVTTNGNDIQHAFDTLGTYNVSCKVKNGCGDSTVIYSQVQVINNSPLSGDLRIDGSLPNPSCPNDTVFFLIKNGQATTKYVWNFGDGSPVDTTIGVGARHVFTAVGNDTLSVVATNSCGVSKTIKYIQNVNLNSYPSLVGSDGKPLFGFPGSDGNNSSAGCVGDAIIFYFMGSYDNNLWDFGDGTTGIATQHMIVNGGGNGGGSMPVTIISHGFASGGSHLVHLTVTNHCGHSVTDSMRVNIGGNQVVNGSLMTSSPPFTTCSSINFMAFGGANYKFNFGDGNPPVTTTSPTVTHSFPVQGIYTVTVVITNGCGNSATYSQSININGAGGPAVTLTSSAPPVCVGGNDGSALISAAGGQLPYSYSWNTTPAQTTAAAANLSAGVYSATVTDNVGCESVFTVSISNPAPIVLAPTVVNSACGAATGSASISITSGGVQPFTYLWSNQSTGASRTGLAFGSYPVTVTDGHGCTASANVSVSELNGPAVVLTSATNPGCNGSHDGAINITVTGGTAPYTYAWSDTAITQDLTNLRAGTYSVTVTDHGNCRAVFNTTISEPAPLSVVTSTVVAPTCGSGNFDGKAKAIVAGGTAPFTYQWDPNTGGINGQTTQTATGLPVGTYSVTVTDSKGCSLDGVIALSNANAPNISEVITNVSCSGLTNGSIVITPSGGTSPYAYMWNVNPPNNNHKDLHNLPQGSYFINLTDSRGCQAIRSYTITMPAPLTAIVTDSGATCGHSNGSATVTTIGGNTSFTYLWNNSQTSQTAVGLAPATYSVTVTDNRGCTASASGTVAISVPKPSICMVTVDDLSINNIIYWNKTMYTNVDSFIVYREVSTAVYKRIAALPYSALSEFIDTARHVGPANGDPNVGAYRYKLQLRDSCGNYSAMSPYHNTIYIAGPDNFGTFNWGLPYAIEGGDPNISNYELICDTTQNTHPWFNVGTVSGTQSSVTDAGFADHQNNSLAQWRVKTDWSTICTPTHAPISTSRSNIKRPSVHIGISEILGDNFAMAVYPNPAKDNVTVELSALTKNAQLKIIDVLGQTVYSETITASSSKSVKQINTSNFAKGIYSIVVETTTGKLQKKLVVN